MRVIDRIIDLWLSGPMELEVWWAMLNLDFFTRCSEEQSTLQEEGVDGHCTCCGREAMNELNGLVIDIISHRHRLAASSSYIICALQEPPGTVDTAIPTSPRSLTLMVYIPGITKTLVRRKGGGKGKGGGSGGSSVKSTPKSTSNLPLGKKSATMYGNGGGRVSTIPSGTVFAGRTVGGGTRSSVFGNRCG